jgi:chromobox protein 1
MMKESNDGASKQRGRKRGRASTVTETPKNGKRSRTSPHPASTSPPASLSERKFQPPTGSWEDAVQNIDACEDHEGNIFVFLTWEGGHKTQHPLEQVYKRCPYKVISVDPLQHQSLISLQMLKFYESHLSFHHRPPSAQNSG